MKERRVKLIELFPTSCPSICIVVRERWVKLTEDRRQQNEEEIIGTILFMYLFEYISPIIHYVEALALLLFRSIIVCIVLFIFKRESPFFCLRCEEVLMEKEESLKKLKM